MLSTTNCTRFGSPKIACGDPAHDVDVGALQLPGQRVAVADEVLALVDPGDQPPARRRWPPSSSPPASRRAPGSGPVGRRLSADPGAGRGRGGGRRRRARRCGGRRRRRGRGREQPPPAQHAATASAGRRRRHRLSRMPAALGRCFAQALSLVTGTPPTRRPTRPRHRPPRPAAPAPQARPSQRGQRAAGGVEPCVGERPPLAIGAGAECGVEPLERGTGAGRIGADRRRHRRPVVRRRRPARAPVGGPSCQASDGRRGSSPIQRPGPPPSAARRAARPRPSGPSTALDLRGEVGVRGAAATAGHQHQALVAARLQHRGPGVVQRGRRRRCAARPWPDRCRPSSTAAAHHSSAAASATAAASSPGLSTAVGAAPLAHPDIDHRGQRRDPEQHDRERDRAAPPVGGGRARRPAAGAAPAAAGRIVSAHQPRPAVQVGLPERQPLPVVGPGGLDQPGVDRQLGGDRSRSGAAAGSPSGSRPAACTSRPAARAMSSS